MRNPKRPLPGVVEKLQGALGAAGVVAWEFDVATATIEYSESPEGRGRLLRPNDSEVSARLLEHANHGAGPCTVEFSVAGTSGPLRIRYQGDVIPDEEGKPLRLTGIAMAASEPVDTEELLRRIAVGVSVTTGETFFRLLVEHLSGVLNTNSACVSALDESNPGVLRAFALFAGGRFQDEVNYNVSGTPCEQALAAGQVSYPRDVQSVFPLDHWLVEHHIEGYLGVRLVSSSGEPLGVMSVMSRSPIENVGSAETILNIFASRASAELERIRSSTDRKRVEDELEEKERFIRRIAETTLNVLFVYDIVERRNVYVNERSADVIGYSAKEILEMGGDFLSQCLHPEDIAQLPQLGAEYASRVDGEVFEHVFRLRHKNGDWRWVHRNATIFSRTPDGRPKQILGACTDITRFKETELEMRSLSGRLLDIQDEERRRIARELHDVTGQNLAALGFNLTLVSRTGALEGAARENLLECQRLCELSQREIRTLSYLLHPPMLDEFGLFGALEWYIEGLKKRTQMEIVLYVQRGIGRLPSDLETDLFRVIQEALTNIVRYSGSPITVIRLEKMNGILKLQIEDHGHGLALKTGAGDERAEIGFGVGIPGMRERLRQHGGKLEITSGAQGTLLTVVVPVGNPGKVSERTAGQP